MNGFGRGRHRIIAGGIDRLCLVENDRHMAGYDQRLLRPAITPALAGFARRFMKST